jgi:hypothetical protein
MKSAYIEALAPVLVCFLWVGAWNTIKALVQT